MNKLLARVVLLWTGMISVGMGATPDRPNLILIMADDQSAGALGCYGNPVIQTPNLDALAARGIRFDQALVSQSICWASRTSFLTGRVGRSTSRPETPDLTRPEEAETLVSDRLRAAGYRTGFYGKWHARMP